MKRTFIAFDILPTAETRNTFEFVRHKLRLEKINWIRSENFHMTLKFLGDTEEKLLPEINISLKKVLSGFAPFDIRLHSIGLFKSLGDPRIIWMGCDGGLKLNEIKQAMEKAMADFGFEPDSRNFKPHLTLGRIQQIRQTNQLAEVIAMHKNSEFQQQKIGEIILYESTLLPEGARYTPLQIFKL